MQNMVNTNGSVMQGYQHKSEKVPFGINMQTETQHIVNHYLDKVFMCEMSLRIRFII